MTTSEVVFGPITELQACQAAHDRLRKINAELCRTANNMNRHGADLRTQLDAAEQAAWALEHANPERNQVLRALHGQVAELTTQLATEREEFESSSSVPSDPASTRPSRWASSKHRRVP
jgi:predicted RNase H-like nuclease (RuvC/YqgF family)